MRDKRWALSVLVLSLGCLAVSAPGAAARPQPLTKPKPKPPAKLLPHRSCKGLLSISDFPGTASESTLAGGIFGPVEQGHSSASNFITTCQFNPPEPTEADPEPDQSVAAADVLSVDSRIEYESRGKPNNLLLSFPQSPETSRYALHGVGTRAFYEINEEGGAVAYMQVRNDVFVLSKETIGGIKELLSRVAHELSPTGK